MPQLNPRGETRAEADERERAELDAKFGPPPPPAKVIIWTGMASTDVTTHRVGLAPNAVRERLIQSDAMRRCLVQCEHCLGAFEARGELLVDDSDENELVIWQRPWVGRTDGILEANSTKTPYPDMLRVRLTAMPYGSLVTSTWECHRQTNRIRFLRYFFFLFLVLMPLAILRSGGFWPGVVLAALLAYGAYMSYQAPRLVSTAATELDGLLAPHVVD